MNFIAKLMGIDFNRSYTNEELEAIRERWDSILRKMIVGTFVLCGAMAIVTFIIQKLR